MKTLSWRAALVVVLYTFGCGVEPGPVVTTGTITGTVSAVGGVALEGADVTTEPATVAVVSDAAGKYTLSSLEAGTYKVIVAANRYTTKERANVAVAAGASVTLDVALDLAGGTAKLTVKDACSAAALSGAKIVRTGAADLLTGSDGVVNVPDLLPGPYSFSVSADGFLPATATGTVVVGATLDLTVDLACQSKAARDLAVTYLGSLTGLQGVVFTARSLQDNLNDGNTTNDPLMVSVRSQADYENGHVPGSISIPYKEIADDASLAKLSGYDPTKGIKGYCYTGHTGGIASAVLNLMGYKTSNMKFGLVGWTRDATARTALGIPPEYPATDNTVSTTETLATATFVPPRLAFADAATPLDVIKLGARAWLKDPAMKAVVTAAALKANLEDGNASNDFFIVDVRAKADYDLGHIPGSINIPAADLAKPGQLEKLPTDREVLMVCYTGHTGGLTTGVLGTLGYKKVTNLKYGYAAWKRPATVYNDAADSNDFLFNTGPTP